MTHRGVQLIWCSTSLRIAIAAVGFAGAIFLPVWVPAIAILVLAFFWRSWEALMLGLLVDFLWLPMHSFPLFTLGAILVVWALEPVRNEFLSR